MILSPAPDDTYRKWTNVLVSENKIVTMGVYRVMYGWRVQAGHLSDLMCHSLSWCGGGNWSAVEELYAILRAILEKREEGKMCFKGLPPVSLVKPYFNDQEFLEFVKQEAGEYEVEELNQPKLVMGGANGWAL